MFTTFTLGGDSKTLFFVIEAKELVANNAKLYNQHYYGMTRMHCGILDLSYT